MLLLVVAIALGASSDFVTGPVEIAAEGRTFSEGPLWLASGQWVFSDVAEDAIYRLDGSKHRSPSHHANGLALDPQGRMIVCESETRRIIRIEADGTETVLADKFEGKRLNAPNDLIVSSNGTVYFTDPQPLRGAEDLALDFSGVYSISPEGALRLLVDDFRYPNGIGLSPDENILYVSDTSKGHIRAFELNSEGGISNGRVHCQVRIPDGLAVDSLGRIWSATSRGIAIVAPDGSFLDRVEFRGMPTNCAFGGQDKRTLCITARKIVYKVEVVAPGL